MRVNITYSVDLDSVPDEISRMLEECARNFGMIHSQLETSIGKSPLDLLDELDSIRMGLAKLDLRLGDSMQILSGYIKAISHQPEIHQAEIDNREQRLAALASQLEAEDEEG